MNYPTCGGGGGPSGGPKEKQLFSAAYTASPYSIDDAMTQIDAAKKNLDVVTTQLDKLVPLLQELVADHGHALAERGGDPREPAPIDPDRVQRGIDLAHDLVLGLSLSVAIVVVLGAPSVVALGWAELGIIGAAGVVQMMRTRQFLLARDVVVGLLGGALGIVAGTVTALLQHPTWGVVIGPVVGVAAAAVLVSLALPDKATVRKGRILDLCEGLALFALVPLLVIALGLIAAFRS